MRKNKNPCYGCSDRAEACHARRERYGLWQKARDAEYERRKQEAAIRWDISAVRGMSIKKLRKPNGGKIGGQL